MESKDAELLIAIEKNIKEIRKELHSLLARIRIVEMALESLTKKLEDED